MVADLCRICAQLLMSCNPFHHWLMSNQSASSSRKYESGDVLHMHITDGCGVWQMIRVQSQQQQQQ